MHTLHAWLARWQLPPQAVNELYAALGVDAPDTLPAGGAVGASEASVQSARVLQAAKQGIRLWRNNSGAFKDDTGRLVRYGLANTGAAINKVIKTSDLIGITPLIVTPQMVGQRIGVFTAEECKAPGWKLRPSDDRAQAQWRFGKLVLSLGGIFRFVSDIDRVI